MANEKVKIADVEIPENWNAYVAENTRGASKFYNSGIVRTVPGISISEGGRQINLPYWNDIEGDAELLSDIEPLTLSKVTAAKQLATVHALGKAFSVNDLARGYSGSDPMGHIASRIGAFWGEQMDKLALATVRGAIGAAEDTHVFDISGNAGAAGVFSREAVIDAAALLGENRGVLSTMIGHSAVVAHMDKLNDSDYFLDADDNLVRTYLGKNVIEADTFEPTNGVYELFLFAPGALGFADGINLAATEVDRDILAGDTLMTSRRSFVLHPMGVSYVKPLDPHKSPSLTDLKDPASWELATSAGNIRVVQFKFRLA